ncbi:sugar transporter [Limimaricola cinnabarinus]|uniref:Sugar transporter n=2 Tax=Limimaricola cinnabarinus TaxID=1125964 RepID=A0A2G1MDL0_9RHOB|nr:sugar transporter [Limimaricola cinnabarinus]
MARPAQARTRHWGLLLSFLLVVLAPAGAASWYLYSRAADQYASTLGFTVRSEELTSAADLLGGLGAGLGGSGSDDSAILYEFVRSQEIVRQIDAKLDLRRMWSRYHETDPLLSFDPSGSIEDLTNYWRRMLNISYDTGSGLMELRALAFSPEEAQAIAQAIYEEGSATINALSTQAREDATRYARADLDQALERLKQAREALTAFRIQNQIVDPSADIQGQMGLLNTLQAQLATALIDFDLLPENVRAGDPRTEQAQRRIEVIRERIAEERQKFGTNGDADGESYATTIAEFERLSVDREFAERAYTAALSAYDAALAEADRQNRYLARYIRPTLAEKSKYPQRELMIGIVALFGFLIWAIGSLIFYSLRDRR